MTNKLIAVLLFVFISVISFAQVDIKYQVPSEEILKLADVPLPPSTITNDDASLVVLLYRNQYKSIAELSEQELKLAGIRTNPVTNMSSRSTFYNNLELIKKGSKEPSQIEGLPDNPRLSNFSWSPDQTKLAFANTASNGTELWYADLVTLKAYRLTGPIINGNLRNRPYTWLKDNNGLLVKILPEDRPSIINKSESIPTGPVISVNDGKKAQNRTYQDLLKDKTDEQNFVTLAESELNIIGLDGSAKTWAPKAIYSSISISPDGEYVLLSVIKKPFSYLVPYYRFSTDYLIYNINGDLIKTLEEVPLIEDLPQGFMAERKGKRDFGWRADKPSTIYWATVLDDGDPEKEVEFRDEIFTLDAPFSDKPKSILKVKNRFSYIIWGNDQIAVAYDMWWNNRNTKTYVFNPEDNTLEPQILFDRNYQDRYNDPGSFITTKNDLDRNILLLDNDNVYLEGDGYSAEGQKPFIDRMNLKTQKKTRLFQAQNKENLETISKVIDIKKGLILTRIQSPTDFPNYYLRNIKSRKAPMPVTHFKNPFESMAGVHKEIIHYTREDSLPLSGTLYLPANYDFNNKERLPLLMWAYPDEFKDKKSAAQVTSSPNEFIYPWYGSPVFWVMKGYAILEDASFPIVGEGDEEPNDTFIPQLVSNAKAAIDYLDEQGYIDRNKVAVGGHSYGAFMTANLLTHSDLFAAGIARSGAYNRTLTPFGFQSEERNYWEAPNIYYEMSPFMHADKMKHPLLLIHGREDNNSGTYTMQSERYFNALKGLGATVRLVLLPTESHSYRAKESVLHLLWEQDQWLEKYVKNKK
ncbi:alpha/beta hydrolase family protein [Carboxylicivirga caseinilyticus]|uniref:alpha/beta hydrolase family protein n=1 Tax=Carboxylicivirga caseinilyticus TaxID=3417572 RepID=UPI003D3512BB|nr:S9 family peptidase [Marinilabiliaceae bacterium A049]